MKGEFSTTKAEFSTLKKLDQNKEILSNPYIWNNVTIKNTFAPKMLSLVTSIKLLYYHKKILLATHGC